MLSILRKCQVEPFRQRYCDISHEVNALAPHLNKLLQAVEGLEPSPPSKAPALLRNVYPLRNRRIL